MSFLYKTTPVLRTATLARPPARLFSTAIVCRKSATETVKAGLKSVDRAVSDVAVAGIDKGAKLKDKAASVVGVETGKAQGKGEELTRQAKGKASEVAAEAKGKASELKGEAKGDIS